tara:strand:- start:83 stop:232 length:150 start_codon:yes stop_codon:yes gene_type:complete
MADSPIILNMYPAFEKKGVQYMLKGGRGVCILYYVELIVSIWFVILVLI